tara:strand:+ start:7245 stop:8765 length:1521 start_codon:yes stop_codon:yes gene_type:complete
LSKLPQPISNYVDRFREQFEALNLSASSNEDYENLINNNASRLNNLLMSGLGACTLILRMGAVINLAKKIEEGSDEEDALLMKQIIDNLREVLPSDTNWKTIWKITCKPESDWYRCVDSVKGKQSLMEAFVTFRNNYVHGIISLRINQVKMISDGIKILNRVCEEVSPLFDNTKIEISDGKYYFSEPTSGLFSKPNKTNLHPFVQGGSEDGLPYIFQGLYDNKKTAELISTFYGDVQEQESDVHYQAVFDPILKSLSGGAGRVFNNQNIIDYYGECFVGREQESDAISKWILDKKIIEKILPIYSQAGMGKGALAANVVSNMSDKEFNIPVLHHFCGSGMANNLHAILYHFILQGRRMQIWNLENAKIFEKLKKLPTKYHELINLFHELLDNLVITRKNVNECLIIVIDGLDEASVAYSEYHIKDYFSKYDDEGQVTGTWEASSNVKWIFTYREGVYNFPDLDNILNLEIVQPLNGLSVSAIQSALKSFNPTSEFIETIAERGKVL